MPPTRGGRGRPTPTTRRIDDDDDAVRRSRLVVDDDVKAVASASEATRQSMEMESLIVGCWSGDLSGGGYVDRARGFSDRTNNTDDEFCDVVVLCVVCSSSYPKAPSCNPSTHTSLSRE
jgi:hypothetical protein